ncbi:MAG: alkaline phosphatase [Planctomycetota bacterium]
MLIVLVAALLFQVAPPAPQVSAEPVGLAIPSDRGSVIFIHPDGAGAATWAAARMRYVGPDDDLNWDLLPEVAVYRGHLRNSLTGTSNAGATVHAYGMKVDHDAFGRDRGGDGGTEPTDSDGNSLSVAKQAIAAGIPTGVVQSGAAIEPGTAAFLADASLRRDFDQITKGLLDSGAAVILGGGERDFLPEGVEGVHGIGSRDDDQNLIEYAKAQGYTVIYTREELLALPADTDKVLGLFAAGHTFNDKSEEELRAAGLPNYDPDAPTVAEMTDVALRILGRGGRQFLLVVEEEGTDNFGNKNNANATLEAAKRADDALGIARRFLRDNPQTLLITTADSDGGGLRPVGFPIRSEDDIPGAVPPRDFNGAPVDGIAGTGTAPFMSAPDRFGRSLPFAVVWSSRNDVAGGVLVRADGFNSHFVRGSFDNTDVAKLIRRTLFAGE